MHFQDVSAQKLHFFFSNNVVQHVIIQKRKKKWSDSKMNKFVLKRKKC